MFSLPREWPEEALALLRSIVDHPEGEQEMIGKTSDEISMEEARSDSEETRAGWEDRDEAYAHAVHLAKTLTNHGYVVEVFLELLGKRYQVVVRGADGELICENPEHIAYLIEQAQDSILERATE